MNKVTTVSSDDYEKALGVFERFHLNNIWRNVGRDDFIVKRFK